MQHLQNQKYKHPQKGWEYNKLFVDAMQKAGVNFSGQAVSDGGIHRFETKRKGRKDGWYVFFGMAGAFGDWRLDINEKWNVSRSSAPVEDFEVIRQQMKMTLRIAEEERHKKYEETAATALKQWESFPEQGTSCYLLKKKVQGFGVRYHKGFLFIPLRDALGKLWSFQIISPDGAKRFLTGGLKKGCFHHIGKIEDGKPILITEGYATGACVYKATQIPTVIAFDAGNLENVVEELKKAYPKSSLAIAGDDDRKKEKNVGREKAEATATKFNCDVVFPQFRNHETAGTDFNDLYLQQGLEEVKTQIISSLQKKKLKTLKMKNLLSMALRTREMIMEPIIPEQGLCMIHAQRGIGKTHVSLLIAHTVAMGEQMFDERWKCKKNNKVLFVDGEMPLNVIQERLSKIYQSEEDKGAVDDQLLVITPDLQSNGIPDLSTPEGQNLIEEHLEGVKLLILDNYSALCRQGRENDAESWIPLQEWFLGLRRRGISVLLIHHSNKTGGQRGTSRKEDLLDTVITLRKPEDYSPRDGARFEVHYEKAREFYGKDASPFEAWLKEENGRFTWDIRLIHDSKIDKIIDLKKEGLTQRDIAHETGLSLATVNRKLKEVQGKGLLPS